MPAAPETHSHLGRIFWLALACLCLLLGMIGAVVPLMPTTVFLLMAAACFARSSPRLEARLLAHPRFGPSIQAWRREGAIPRRGKYAACVGMTLGYGLFCLGARPGWPLASGVAIAMTACALWIVSRPAPNRP